MKAASHAVAVDLLMKAFTRSPEFSQERSVASDDGDIVSIAQDLKSIWGHGKAAWDLGKGVISSIGGLFSSMFGAHEWVRRVIATLSDDELRILLRALSRVDSDSRNIYHDTFRELVLDEEHEAKTGVKPLLASAFNERARHRPVTSYGTPARFRVPPAAASEGDDGTPPDGLETVSPDWDHVNSGQADPDVGNIRDGPGRQRTDRPSKMAVPGRQLQSM